MKDWYEYESVDCIICESNETTNISDRGQFGLDTHVNLCENCGLGYLNPRWNREAYLDFYRYEYDKYYRPNPLTDEEVHKKYGEGIVKRISAFLPESVKEILDIGSGNGQLLSSLKSKFQDSNLFAIEPSGESKKSLDQRKVELVSDSVDTNWDKSFRDRFDLIIMRHVLEHFSNPLEVLSKVKNTLSDNGLLYIAVPNCLKPSPNLKGKWFRVVHTYYFNRYSLHNLIAKTGLELVQIVEGDSYGPHEIFLVARKGDAPNLEISHQHYSEQLHVYHKQIEKESSLLYPIIKRLEKLKKLFL